MKTMKITQNIKNEQELDMLKCKYNNNENVMIYYNGWNYIFTILEINENDMICKLKMV